jgi:hypothetical protein
MGSWVDSFQYNHPAHKPKSLHKILSSWGNSDVLAMKSMMETPPKEKPLDQVRDAVWLKHYPRRIEETYIQ